MTRADDKSETRPYYPCLYAVWAGKRRQFLAAYRDRLDAEQAALSVYGEVVLYVAVSDDVVAPWSPKDLEMEPKP